MKKIYTMIRKEWSEVFKNPIVLFAIIFIPLIFTILPLGILYGTVKAGDITDIPTEEISSQFNKLCEGLTSDNCGQYILLSQFTMLFMMMPVIIPVTIASYSIVGEKSTRTLEPLLATPITTFELLAGKALAAITPALVATWLGFSIYVIGANILDVPPQVISKLFSPLWLMSIFVVGPLLSIASVSLAVMISSRANDPRVAEQIAGLLVIPIVGLLIGQTSGLFFIDQNIIIWIAVGVVVLDAVLLFFAVNLFQRETILTRWK